MLLASREYLYMYLPNGALNRGADPKYFFSKTLTYKRESSNGPLEIPYTHTDSRGDSHLFRAENYRNTTQNL